MRDWADAFAQALLWISWTGRRRWPDHAVNDELWAAGIADWWVGSGPVGRDG